MRRVLEMLWKLFFGKSKEEYLKEVLDHLSGMDSHYSELTSGMEDVRELLEASKLNGGLQEEKLDRLLTIMEDWMNTYEEKVHQPGLANELELKKELERERERMALKEEKEKEYQHKIDLQQAETEEYKQKYEESEKSVWSMQKEVQSLKRQLTSMQNNQFHSVSKKRKAAASTKQAVGGVQGLSKEDQNMIKESYDLFPVDKNSKMTIFNPMRYSK
jgi:predicted RNase H-like nuclease (RuvC/YqgF family)